MHMLNFSTELQDPENSVTLLKSDSITDALQPILKFSKQTKEIFDADSVFDILESSNFVKGTLLNTFF